MSVRTSTINHWGFLLPSDCNHLFLVFLSKIVGFSSCQAISGALDSYEDEGLEDVSYYQCCLEESQGSHNFSIPNIEDLLDVQLMMAPLL